MPVRDPDDGPWLTKWELLGALASGVLLAVVWEIVAVVWFFFL